MHLDLTLTADGILEATAIFLGAAIGVCAVFWQIRSSARELRSQLKADSGNLQMSLEAQQANLKAQLDAEKEARDGERENQKNALATALHFEIQSFVLYELDGVQQEWKNCNPAENTVPPFIWLRERSFPVYEGGADKLGSLSGKTLVAAVGFYTLGGAYRAKCSEYNACMSLVYKMQNTDLMAARAKVLLKRIQDLAPMARELALSALKRLEAEHGTTPTDINLNAQTN
ncbi:MAG: hypothetical protein ACRD11_16740 [Terriglobia bacterium]